MISNERLEELAGDFILNGFATVGECTEIARELLALRKAFSEPVLWEVKGLYCHTYNEAKSLYPDREPDPLFYKPD